jgi:hypothetical protein
LAYVAGGSTDQQAFCYDEQNRLVWATSQTARGPNSFRSNRSLSGGSVACTVSYGYDTLVRLTGWAPRFRAV